jgi:hypothetical protein
MDPVLCRVYVFVRDRATPLTLVERTFGQLAQYPPDQLDVTLSLTDGVFLRSSTWARWPLGILWPVA